MQRVLTQRLNGIKDLENKMGEIDFSRGGYSGGDDENFFKPLTLLQMEWWWQFREVLRAGERKKEYWQFKDGNVLTDDAQKEMIAISLVNYAVHTGVIEALTFTDELQLETKRMFSPVKFMTVRRLWKAAYSSLYSSFNSLCNLVYVLVNQSSVWKKNEPTFVMNYTPNETIKSVEKQDRQLADLLSQCNSRLEIRSHLDHYWTVWISLEDGRFFMDENFKKGYVVLDPSSEVKVKIDALKKIFDDIQGNMETYNQIYRKLTIKSGYLDKYLDGKGWKIDYTNYQPHGGKRPITINGD